MAELRLNGEMHLLSTRYRVSADCACRFKRQKWMVEVLRETSSDIGRIGLTGHERELLNPLTMIIHAKGLSSILLGRYHWGSICPIPKASRTALAFADPVLLLTPKAAH